MLGFVFTPAREMSIFTLGPRSEDVVRALRTRFELADLAWAAGGSRPDTLVGVNGSECLPWTYIVHISNSEVQYCE